LPNLAKSVPAAAAVAVVVVDTVAVGETATDLKSDWEREITRGLIGLIRCLAPLDTSLSGWSAKVLPSVGTGRGPKRVMKEAPVEVEGVVHTVLPGTMFRVELDNKHLVLATISGKMRKRWVRLTVGDRVKMEMSPYDLDKARIVWRLK
jgi:translation initiation factor IF-1